MSDTVRVGRMQRQIMMLDAVGLGVLAAAALGTLTGIGGGMMRDVAAGRVPAARLPPGLDRG